MASVLTYKYRTEKILIQKDILSNTTITWDFKCKFDYIGTYIYA